MIIKIMIIIITTLILIMITITIIIIVMIITIIKAIIIFKHVQVHNDNEEPKLSDYGLIRQMCSLDLVV